MGAAMRAKRERKNIGRKDERRMRMWGIILGLTLSMLVSPANLGFSLPEIDETVSGEV